MLLRLNSAADSQCVVRSTIEVLRCPAGIKRSGELTLFNPASSYLDWMTIFSSKCLPLPF